MAVCLLDFIWLPLGKTDPQFPFGFCQVGAKPGDTHILMKGGVNHTRACSVTGTEVPKGGAHAAKPTQPREPPKTPGGLRMFYLLHQLNSVGNGTVYDNPADTSGPDPYSPGFGYGGIRWAQTAGYIEEPAALLLKWGRRHVPGVCVLNRIASPGGGAPTGSAGVRVWPTVHADRARQRKYIP